MKILAEEITAFAVKRTSITNFRFLKIKLQNHGKKSILKAFLKVGTQFLHIFAGLFSQAFWLYLFLFLFRVKINFAGAKWKTKKKKKRENSICRKISVKDVWINVSPISKMKLGYILATLQLKWQYQCFHTSINTSNIIYPVLDRLSFQDNQTEVSYSALTNWPNWYHVTSIRHSVRNLV